MTIQTWLLIVTLCFQAFLAVDRWVHRRERGESELGFRLDNLSKNLDDRLEAIEQFRALRATSVDTHITRLEAHLKFQDAKIEQEMRRLHDAASDHADAQQLKMGALSERVLLLTAQIEELRRRRKDDMT